MKVLDLFCGGKSMKKPCEEIGFEYYSIDIEKNNAPDLLADIGKLNKNDINFIPDIIWASPPCTCFSVASIGKHWNKDRTPKSENAKKALILLSHTIELIEELKPIYYFIENPRGMMRKLPMMSIFPIRNTVTYCQYGDKRMKPTDIWTNCFSWKPKPPCKNGDSCHVSAPRGSRTGTQGMSLIEKWHIPHDLLYEILRACIEPEQKIIYQERLFR